MNFCTTANNLWCDVIMVQQLQNEMSSMDFVSDKRGVFVFIFKDSLAEFLFCVSARKHDFLTAFVLSHTKVWYVFFIVMGILKDEENRVLDGLEHHSQQQYRRRRMTFFFFRRSLPRLSWLEETQ